MAIFSTTFLAVRLIAPDYEEYTVTASTQCSDDTIPHPISFNNTSTGDFVVGYNWDNGGLLPDTITILGFTDTTEIVDTTTGDIISNTVPSNTLRDTSTGLNLTYPYVLSINDIDNIVENINSNEIYCQDSGSSKFETTRTRAIQYYIENTEGIAGPTRTAYYVNIQD